MYAVAGVGGKLPTLAGKIGATSIMALRSALEACESCLAGATAAIPDVAPPPRTLRPAKLAPETPEFAPDGILLAGTRLMEGEEGAAAAVFAFGPSPERSLMCAECRDR